MILINGPDPLHADPVIKEAMVSYWKDKKNKNLVSGHFRRSNNIKTFVAGSKVLQTMATKEAKKKLTAV